MLEAYADGWKTTGVTYQADNQPTPTTELGSGVDVSFLPIIGLSGRLDWGVKPYAAGDNGGIVGTVSYGTTRNEVDPSQAVTEDYQPGIPGLQVDLFKPVACDANTPAASCSSDGYVLAADGSYELGDWINRYQTESWQRPKNCTARTVTGDPLVGEQALPRTTDPLGNPVDCIEAPMMGIQFGGDDPFNSPNPDANFFSSVDGNYGFGDAWTTPATPDRRRLARSRRNPGSGSEPLTPGDYIVKVEIPNDPIQGRPLYTPTREEDVNVFTRRLVQAGLPAAALRRRAAHRARHEPGLHRRAAAAPSTARQRPLCDAKLVPVRDAQVDRARASSSSPTCRSPAKFWGLVNDNLNVSIDPEGDALRRDRRHRQRAGRALRLHGSAGRHGAHRPERLLHGARPLDEHVQLPASGRPLPEHVPRGRQRPGPALGAQPRLPPRVRHDLGELPGLAGADAARSTRPTRPSARRCSRPARTSPSRCSA